MMPLNWYKLFVITLLSALKTMFTQRSHDTITVMWKMRHFTSEQNTVNKCEVIEKVIPAVDF